MDYEKQLDSFYTKLNFNKLSTNAIALYQAIVHIAKGASWIKELSIANITLMSICNLTIKELQNARNELINKKFLEYKKGRNQNEAPKYYLIRLYEVCTKEIRQPEGQAQGKPVGQAVRQAQGITQGYINTLHFNTTLDSFFDYINNSAQDFFDNGKDQINLQDKAIIIMHLKRLGILVENQSILELFTENKLIETKIFYWVIKEIYFSSYRIFLNNLTYNNLCLRFLKSKEYVSGEEGIDVERLIPYFIKCIQTDMKEEKVKWKE